MVKRAPSFSFLGRPKKFVLEPSDEVKEKPSPGEYEVNDGVTRSQKGGASIGLGNKMLGYYSNMKRRVSPGPGSYF